MRVGARNLLSTTSCFCANNNILMEIYDEMFGFDCNLNQNNLNGFDFINVFDGNEYLKEPYNNFTLGQRLDMGAQMILYIKEKYPLLAQFHISRT